MGTYFDQTYSSPAFTYNAPNSLTNSHLSSSVGLSKITGVRVQQLSFHWHWVTVTTEVQFFFHRIRFFNAVGKTSFETAHFCHFTQLPSPSQTSKHQSPNRKSRQWVETNRSSMKSWRRNFPTIFAEFDYIALRSASTSPFIATFNLLPGQLKVTIKLLHCKDIPGKVFPDSGISLRCQSLGDMSKTEMSD